MHQSKHHLNLPTETSRAINNETCAINKEGGDGSMTKIRSIVRFCVCIASIISLLVPLP